MAWNVNKMIWWVIDLNLVYWYGMWLLDTLVYFVHLVKNEWYMIIGVCLVFLEPYEYNYVCPLDIWIDKCAL